MAEYDGRAFARDGIVCVTINYRLGAEGFLLHRRRRRPTSGCSTRSPRCAGCRTTSPPSAATRAASPWPASRPGDEHHHAAGHAAAGGLFRQAITQSGPAPTPCPPREPHRWPGYLADALGVAADRQAIAALPPDQVAQAAARSPEVQTAPDPARWGGLALSLLPFCPTVDGDVLPAEPLAALAGGAASDVPC